MYGRIIGACGGRTALEKGTAMSDQTVMRNRIARLAPHSRITRGLCTDRFHTADDEEMDQYAGDRMPIGEGWVAGGFTCPTCGFSTFSTVPQWREPWYRFREWVTSLSCRREGHRVRSTVVDGVTIYGTCRCHAVSGEPSR